MIVPATLSEQDYDALKTGDVRVHGSSRARI